MPVSEAQIIAHLEAHVANIYDAVERLRPHKFKSKRDVVERRWQILLLTLSADAVRGFITMLKARNHRSAIILARSIFEYRIKSEYFLANRKEAYRQYRLIPKRVHADLSKLPAPDDAAAAELVNMYLEWRRTAGRLADDYAGGVGVSKMFLTIAGDKRHTSDGIEYSPEFIDKYGIPSWTVHADAAAIAQVFLFWNSDDNWMIGEASLFEQLGAASQVMHTLFDHLRAVRIHYNMDVEPLERLRKRSIQIQDDLKRECRK